MDKTKKREDEIDRKIAQLREKNKRIEQKFNMVQEEKRIAEAEAALVVSPKSPRNQKFKAFSNAHMDGRKVQRDNFKKDRGDYQDQYSTNRPKERSSRQGNGSGDYAHSPHFQQSMNNHRTDQQMSDETNFRSLKQKNSQTYGRRRYSERDDEMPQEGDEDFGWQNQRSFLYDPSRDRPGEPRRSVPPRNVQYQHRGGRGGRMRGGRGGGRGGRGYNNNPEVQMTGRERLEHERWLQQREEADRERMKRAQAGDGQWRRAWDVEKNHGKREERNDYEVGDHDDHSNYNHAVPHRGRRRGGRRSNDNRYDREAPNRRTKEETEVQELDSSNKPLQGGISSPVEESRKSKSSRRGGRRGNRKTKNQAGSGDEEKPKDESAVGKNADDDAGGAKESDESAKKKRESEVAEGESSSCVDETSSLNASHTAYDLLSDDDGVDKSSADSSMMTADPDKNDDERAGHDEKDSSLLAEKLDDGDVSCSENKPERNADVSIVESDLSNSTEFFDTVEEVADNKDDKSKSSHEIQKLEPEKEKYQTKVDDYEAEVQVSEIEVVDSETQHEESETKVEKSETKVEKSETKVEESETKVEESETKVEKSETKVEESETKVGETETKVEESETKVEESETKVEETETKVEESETKVEETETKVEASETKVEEFETKVGETETRVGDSGTKIE